ncbi:MAG: SDR family oxidoreductase [Pseudomonadota bacterium]|nr:SDR family oxidoreductase [Pseudomonadota bacterium]
MTLDFKDRVILVNGVARGGIGGATVRALAALGAHVACVDRTKEVLDETLDDIRHHESRAIGIVADLLDPTQTDAIIPRVVEEFGRLDGVVNVAGGTRQGEWRPLELTEVDGFRDTINLNLEYAFRICRDAARSRIARGKPAPMVNISSVSGLNSAPFHGPYGAAKSGLIALTRTMAFEWAKYGIRVNVVSPGAVPSERVIAKNLSPDAFKQEGAINDVVQTTVDELAGAIVFLLSDLASGISGHNLVVDSGITTRNAVLAVRMDAVKAN